MLGHFILILSYINNICIHLSVFSILISVYHPQMHTYINNNFNKIFGLSTQERHGWHRRCSYSIMNAHKKEVYHEKSNHLIIGNCSFWPQRLCLPGGRYFDTGGVKSAADSNQGPPRQCYHQ